MQTSLHTYTGKGVDMPWPPLAVKHSSFSTPLHVLPPKVLATTSASLLPPWSPLPSSPRASNMVVVTVTRRTSYCPHWSLPSSPPLPHLHNGTGNDLCFTLTTMVAVTVIATCV